MVRCWVVLLLLLLVAAAPDAGPQPPCAIQLDMVPNAPRFEAFAALAAPPVLQPKQPVLDTADKRKYRTRITEGVEEGERFAGRFTIASWGCGTQCLQFAIIDPATGAVFYREPNGIAGAPWHDGFFEFRGDSRLIVLVGERMDSSGQDRTGVFYLEWTGTTLRELRYEPQEKVCRREP